MALIGANGNIICKPHNLSGGLKSEVKAGFAFVQQKTDIVSLEVVMDCSILENPNHKQFIPAGSLIFVKEERLTTTPWGKTTMKLSGKDVILVPGSEVIAISSQNQMPRAFWDSDLK
jgi:hypothetical protein